MSSSNVSVLRSSETGQYYYSFFYLVSLLWRFTMKMRLTILHFFIIFAELKNTTNGENLFFPSSHIWKSTIYEHLFILLRTLDCLFYFIFLSNLSSAVVVVATTEKKANEEDSFSEATGNFFFLLFFFFFLVCQNHFISTRQKLNCTSISNKLFISLETLNKSIYKLNNFYLWTESRKKQKISSLFRFLFDLRIWTRKIIICLCFDVLLLSLLNAKIFTHQSVYRIVRRHFYYSFLCVMCMDARCIHLELVFWPISYHLKARQI